MAGWGTPPVQGGGSAGQSPKVPSPGGRLKGFHIGPVRRANDVKEGLQLCLGSTVARPSLRSEHLPTGTTTTHTCMTRCTVDQLVRLPLRLFLRSGGHAHASMGGVGAFASRFIRHTNSSRS